MYISLTVEVQYVVQRLRWHFKSGQATANKRSWVGGGGGRGEGLQQATGRIKMRGC